MTPSCYLGIKTNFTKRLSKPEYSVIYIEISVNREDTLWMELLISNNWYMFAHLSGP